MTSIQYLQFVTVAECRNITKAANKLMIAQPALTNQIKRLEEELGTTLFVRNSRSVELTETGRIFYEAARKILQQESNLRTDISLLKSGGGTLRLGVTRFLPDAQFENILQQYKEMYPQVVISLRDDIRDNILHMLEAGSLEVAVVNGPTNFPPNFHVQKLASAQLYACRTREIPELADVIPGETISLIRMKGIPLSVPRALREYITDCCQKEGFSPVIDAISDSRYATLNLARIGGSTALLVLNANALNEKDFIFNPVESPNIAIARHRVTYGDSPLSEAARNFIRLLDQAYSVDPRN